MVNACVINGEKLHINVSSTWHGKNVKWRNGNGGNLKQRSGIDWYTNEMADHFRDTICATERGVTVYTYDAWHSFRRRGRLERGGGNRGKACVDEWVIWIKGVDVRLYV